MQHNFWFWLEMACLVIGYGAAVFMCGFWAMLVMEKPRWVLRLLVQRGVDRDEARGVAEYKRARQLTKSKGSEKGMS